MCPDGIWLQYCLVGLVNFLFVWLNLTMTPFQQPNAASTSASRAKRRGIRNTFASSVTSASTFRDAVRFSAIQQIPSLVISGMFLDHGLILKRVVIATIAYWILALLIMIRRGADPTTLDILVIKWSYFPLILFTFLIWAWYAQLTGTT